MTHGRCASVTIETLATACAALSTCSTTSAKLETLLRPQGDIAGDFMLLRSELASKVSSQSKSSTAGAEGRTVEGLCLGCESVELARVLLSEHGECAKRMRAMCEGSFAPEMSVSMGAGLLQPPTPGSNGRAAMLPLCNLGSPVQLPARALQCRLARGKALKSPPQSLVVPQCVGQILLAATQTIF